MEHATPISVLTEVVHHEHEETAYMLESAAIFYLKTIATTDNEFEKRLQTVGSQLMVGGLNSLTPKQNFPTKLKGL